MTPFFTLSLRSTRDLVIARQRARQIARLLGFEPLEQAGIAASVWELARRAGRGSLHFQIEEDVLQVFASRNGMGTSLRLEKPLPEKTALTREDLAWAVAELAGHTPLKLAEEMQQQNQEMLLLLHDLHRCRAELAQLRGETKRLSAA